MYVVLEWNQASGMPRVADDEVYDTVGPATEARDDYRKRVKKIGRREQYTVHSLDDEEEEG